MKYAVLIIGAVLILGGGVAIYSGYDVLVMERGWASLIAGTTAVVGGVIIAVLGLILRSLERLGIALEATESRRTAVPALEPAEAVELSEPPPALAREEPVFRPSSGAEATVEDVERKSPRPVAIPTGTAEQKPLSRAASAFVNAAAKARDVRAEPSIGELWRRVGVNLDKPAQAEDEPARSERKSFAQKPQEPPPEPADWLDEALARFDAAPAPEAAGTDEEAAPPLAPNSPALEPVSPEVIGRYEAEGTAYVMFADGSIEAQSEQGVLRFNSMAELKAFFES